jgi:cytochrome c-type biogenesis protein CcmH
MDIPSPVKGLALLVILVWLFPLAAGVVNAQVPGPTPALEQPLGYDPAEAYAIDGMIMCPVCPAETIDQAQVPVARQMRALVRKKLGEGATRQEILDFFAQRYGQDILAAPPKSGFNLVAWIFPLVGVSAALAAGLLVLRSMSARRVAPAATAPQTAGSADELAPYLTMVDQELARRENLPAADPAGPDGDTSDSFSGNV